MDSRSSYVLGIILAVVALPVLYKTVRYVFGNKERKEDLERAKFGLHEYLREEQEKAMKRMDDN